MLPSEMPTLIEQVVILGLKLLQYEKNWREMMKTMKEQMITYQTSILSNEIEYCDQ